jgi:hypothetical protein
MQKSVIEQLVQYFKENPSHLKTSFERLQKRFQCSEDQIRLAKEVFKNDGDSSRKDQIVFHQDKEDMWVTERKWVKRNGESQLLVRKKEEESDWLQLMEKLIRDQVPVVQLLPVITYNEPASLNIYLSDEHIGACPQDGLYESAYNEQVLWNRLYRILQEIEDLYAIFGTFKHITVFNMGDSIDGFNGQTTRGGHQLPQNLSNQEMLETHFRVHKNFLSILIDKGLGEIISYHALSNTNHGGDIEYACHRLMEVYLNAAYPDVKTSVVTKFMDHFVIGNRCFIVTHGKDKKEMSNGWPLDLTAKIESFVNQYIQLHKLSEYEIFVVKGDLHQSKSEQGKFFRYRNVSSMYGSSGWVMQNFGLTKPGCDYDLMYGDKILEGTIRFD